MKLAVGFGVLLLIMAAMSTLSYTSIHRLSDLNDDVIKQTAMQQLAYGADDGFEMQINGARTFLFQGVVIEVDELLCAEVESRLTAGSAPRADDVRAGLTCELGCHRTDYAGRTVHEEALPRMKAAVLEQPPATRSGPASRGPHPP